MGILATRAQRRKLKLDNAKQPAALREVPREQWPNPYAPQLRVWRSKDFLVQEFYAAAPAKIRLSVCRTTLLGDRWQDGITWDDLQRLKRKCGYGNADAIEIFPADTDVVNVANMRHLWIMADPVTCAWRKPSNADLTGHGQARKGIEMNKEPNGRAPVERRVKPPRCRRPDETAEEYRIAMGWDKPSSTTPPPAPWQPMRSAPKDGTAILALLQDSDIAHAIRWSGNCHDECWVIVWDGHQLTESDGPRYWMTIPDDHDA